jgi:hypothetical protein
MLYSLIPFVLVLSNALPQTIEIEPKKPASNRVERQFNYSVKKYKINNVEYSRVPTKWKKEAAAN